LDNLIKKKIKIIKIIKSIFKDGKNLSIVQSGSIASIVFANSGEYSSVLVQIFIGII
jgi:hypothetical protein